MGGKLNFYLKITGFEHIFLEGCVNSIYPAYKSLNFESFSNPSSYDSLSNNNLSISDVYDPIRITIGENIIYTAKGWTIWILSGIDHDLFC